MAEPKDQSQAAATAVDYEALAALLDHALAENDASIIVLDWPKNHSRIVETFERHHFYCSPYPQFFLQYPPPKTMGLHGCSF